MARPALVDERTWRGSPRGIEVVHDVEPAGWHDFVTRTPHSNIFHTPEMARVFASTRGHRVTPWAARRTDGSVVALLVPVEVTLAGGPFRTLTSRAVSYGGVLSARDAEGHHGASALLAEYARQRSRHVLFTELRHQDDISALGPALRIAGFAHERHCNFLIDLRGSEADIWRRLSRSAKQRIKSAERRGVEVVEAVDGPANDAAYRLLEQVYRRVGVPLASRTLFDEARAVLQPQGMLRVVTARAEGRVVGARFLLVHGTRIIDWYAGSDRAFASCSPNEVLVWDTLRWGHANGYELFDFGGAGRPDEPYGPREFKAKFGGELVDYGRDVLVHAPARLRLSRAAFAAAQRARTFRTHRTGSERAP
jgi:CelD/BcsL family acetyltransferase involved in cellulose biosynthesis